MGWPDFIFTEQSRVHSNAEIFIYSVQEVKGTYAKINANTHPVSLSLTHMARW